MPGKFLLFTFIKFVTFHFEYAYSKLSFDLLLFQDFFLFICLEKFWFFWLTFYWLDNLNYYFLKSMVFWYNLVWLYKLCNNLLCELVNRLVSLACIVLGQFFFLIHSIELYSVPKHLCSRIWVKTDVNFFAKLWFL